MMNTMLKTMTSPTTRSISAFGMTDVGRQRAVNQDALLIADLVNTNFSVGTRTSIAHLNEGGALLVIADGMSGAVAGEVASELAITSLRNEFSCAAHRQPVSRRLKEAVERANQRIWDLAQRQRNLLGMGSTLTAALICDGVARIAQVGDSRGYLIRGSSIQQITKDQSLVQQLVDAGLLDPRQSASHPYRNIMTQALGREPAIEVALTEFRLHPGDYLLLCSDGLSNKIRPEEIRLGVQKLNSISESCHRLIELANRRGGEDNISIIVARFDGNAFSASTEKLFTVNSRTGNRLMRAKFAVN